MRVIFIEKEGAKRYAGYTTVGYSSSSDKETVVKASEKELNNLTPDRVNSWKEVSAKFVLENEEIGFDSDYSPPNPTGGS